MISSSSQCEQYQVWPAPDSKHQIWTTTCQCQFDYHHQYLIKTLTMINVQTDRNIEQTPACHAPVVRSVYQAFLTRGLPHQLGLVTLNKSIKYCFGIEINFHNLPFISPLNGTSIVQSACSDCACCGVEAQPRAHGHNTGRSLHVDNFITTDCVTKQLFIDLCSHQL